MGIISILCSPPARAGTALVVAACAGVGGLWLWYRHQRSVRESGADMGKRKKTALCNQGVCCQPPVPAENPKLKRCVDIAIGLHKLPYTGAGDEKSDVDLSPKPPCPPSPLAQALVNCLVSCARDPVETSFCSELPPAIILRQRTKEAIAHIRNLNLPLPACIQKWAGQKSRFLAVVVALFLVLSLLLVLFAALLSVQVEIRMAVLAIGLTCWLYRGGLSRIGVPYCRGGGRPVAVVRAVAEVPGSVAPMVWREMATWAAVPPGSLATRNGSLPDMDERGMASRGALGVAVEARLCVTGLAVAPLVAFVLQPRDSDSPSSSGPLLVHAYFVPGKPMSAASAEGVVRLRLQELLACVPGLHQGRTENL